MLFASKPSTRVGLIIPAKEICYITILYLSAQNGAWHLTLEQRLSATLKHKFSTLQNKVAGLQHEALCAVLYLAQGRSGLSNNQC